MGPTEIDKANRHTLLAFGACRFVELGSHICGRDDCCEFALAEFVHEYGEQRSVYLCRQHLASSADACRTVERNMSSWARRIVKR